FGARGHRPANVALRAGRELLTSARPMDLAFLPPLNAALNATATVLLIVGRRLARRGELERHRRVMVAAFSVSSVFLVSYLVHKTARQFENTTFNAEGAAKAAYLALLASHVLLAMT